MDIADAIRRIKDEIFALEAKKQACLNITEEELRADTGIADRALRRAEAMNPAVQPKWEEALIQLEEYQTRVAELTGARPTLPAFAEGHWESFWTNQAQLRVPANTANQVLSLARRTGA